MFDAWLDNRFDVSNVKVLLQRRIYERQSRNCSYRADRPREVRFRHPMTHIEKENVRRRRRRGRRMRLDEFIRRLR